MLKNYLKTSFRNLWKNKGYSFLNIFGLATGIACAALIFLWVEDELDFNDYFSNQAALYKIKDSQTYDGATFTFDATPGPLAQGIKNDFPGIRATARSSWNQRLLFSHAEKNIYEQGNYVDSGFLSMFHLKFIRGNAATAFTQLNSLVISKKMADKFFGSDDAIGKTLKVDNKESYVITGVIQDLPESVSFQFDWLSPFKIFEERNTWLQDWGSNGILTYVELDPGTNTIALNKKLYDYIDGKQKGSIAKMSIYPMTRWRLYDSFENGKEVAGRVKYVKLFSLIAWIILLIACINFMNLSTARSEKRAREVGVRKVMGAGKSKLIFQFIGESIQMSLLAALTAVLLVFLFLPAFNALVGKHLSMNILNPVHIGGLLAITLACGLIAGSYPAFYLSSFKPATVLKGLKIRTGTAGAIRKGLVILQFSVSVILIISTILIYQQIQHVKQRDLGYTKSGLVYMDLNAEMKNHFNLIKNDLMQTGLVENAALSRSTALNMGSNTGDFQWEGKDPNKQVLITVEAVSSEYISTMGLHLTKGRDFYADAKSDSNDIIINETFARLVKKKDIIGSLITLHGTTFTVVGVVNDFIYNNMYQPGAPLMFYSDTASVNFLTVRFKRGADLAAALPAVKKVMQNDSPGYPFEYTFVDEQFAKFFKTETLIGQLAAVFAILAVFISCLGLFGLAAYTAEKRTKEIGIRKVLGASVQGLAGLLSRDFLKLVFISCLIAFPLAWWMMNSWLESYAYRIKINWIIFLIAGALALAIAWFTVIFQAIKAAVTNPVKSLRSE
jgi:predicted permease